MHSRTWSEWMLASIGAAALLLAAPSGAYAAPLQQAVAHGREIFAHDTFGGRGLTCNSCHSGLGKTQGHLPNGAAIPSLVKAAAIFPRYKPRLHKVVTLEQQVRGCVAGALGGKPPAYGSRTLVDLIAYLGSLAQGQPVHIGGAPR
ncbi:MAG: cytochrome C [Gammaproteobacteria bacterium]